MDAVVIRLSRTQILGSRVEACSPVAVHLLSSQSTANIGVRVQVYGKAETRCPGQVRWTSEGGQLVSVRGLALSSFKPIDQQSSGPRGVRYPTSSQPRGNVMSTTRDPTTTTIASGRLHTSVPPNFMPYHSRHDYRPCLLRRPS